MIDNLIVSPDWLTWLQNQEASGQKQRLIVCVLSVTEWLMSVVATRILIRTYKFRTANKSLPPLCIFVSQDPWHPVSESSWRNIGLDYTRWFVIQRQYSYSDRYIREEYWKWWMLRLGVQFSLSWNITNGPITALDTKTPFGQCDAYQHAVRSVRCIQTHITGYCAEYFLTSALFRWLSIQVVPLYIFQKEFLWLFFFSV